MHEVSLFGHVPLARHEQLLNILAGLAGMHPVDVLERRMLFEPLAGSQPVKPPKKNPTEKPVQNQVASNVQLIEALLPQDFGSKRSGFSSTDHESPPDQSEQAGNRSWTLRIQDIPEPEAKSVTLRKVVEVDVAPEDVNQYLDATKYRFIGEYIVEGQRVICKDVVLSLHRVLKVPIADAKPGPVTTLPPLEDLVLLDVSGAFVLEATVRIEDRTKPTLVQTANDELNWLKTKMKGVVELRAPERLALDSRVRNL